MQTFCKLINKVHYIDINESKQYLHLAFALYNKYLIRNKTYDLQQNPAAKKRVIVGVAVVGECGCSAGRAHRVGNTPSLPRPLRRDAPSSLDIELRTFFL